MGVFSASLLRHARAYSLDESSAHNFCRQSWASMTHETPAWHAAYITLLHCLQYYDESRKELAAAQSAAATVTVGGAEPKTPAAKSAGPLHPVTAGPTPMTS